MSAGGGGAEGGDEGGEFELNLAPIIDCFTVLITYMLVSASFLSLDFLDVSVAVTREAPPADEASPPPTPPKAVVTLSGRIGANKVVTFKVTDPAALTPGREGLGVETFEIAPDASGGYDSARLIAQVDQIHQRWPSAEDLSLSADDGVIYKDVVTVVEAIKKVHPRVFLGE